MLFRILISLFLFSTAAHATPADDLWGETDTAKQGQATVMALPVTVNENVEVSGDYILLGDVFSGLTEEQARVRLSKAPALKQQVVLNAAWLNDAAKRNGLNFHAEKNAQSTVTRAFREITENDILKALHNALKDKDFPKDADIVLNTRGKTYAVAKNERVSLEFEKIAYNAAQATVTGTLVIVAGGKKVERDFISGKAVSYVTVPTAARAMTAGETLSEKDIIMKKIPVEQVQNAPLSAEDINSKEIRRGVRAGQVLTAADVRVKVAVPKGKIINLLYNKAGLSLKTQGKALENGVIGEVIRIQNLQSKAVIEGVVIDAETAAVAGKK